jgi:hypothetical protein
MSTELSSTAKKCFFFQLIKKSELAGNFEMDFFEIHKRGELTKTEGVFIFCHYIKKYKFLSFPIGNEMTEMTALMRLT